MKLSFRTTLFCSVIVSFSVGCCLYVSNSHAQPLAPAPQAPAEYAIVLNKTFAPEATLPEIMQQSDLENARTQCQQHGLKVYTDDTIHCIAVCAGRTLTKSDLEKESTSDNLLADTIVADLTPQQLKHRDENKFLRIDDLTEMQHLTLEQLARRSKQVDPKHHFPPRTQIKVSIEQYSTRYIATRWKGQPYVFDMPCGAIQPPTPAVVDAAPLRGSALWWMWPHREDLWGDAKVDLKQGSYHLGALLKELSKNLPYKLEVEKQAEEMEIVATAKQMPLRKFLWAVEAACGLYLRTLPRQQPNLLFLTPRLPIGESNETRSAHLMFAVPGTGGASTLKNEAARSLLKDLPELGKGATERILAYHYKDLPLLYRHEIQAYFADIPAAKNPLPKDAKDLEMTCVLWTEAIEVVVYVVDAKGQDTGGASYVLPAL